MKLWILLASNQVNCRLIGIKKGTREEALEIAAKLAGDLKYDVFNTISNPALSRQLKRWFQSLSVPERLIPNLIREILYKVASLDRNNDSNENSGNSI